MSAKNIEFISDKQEVKIQIQETMLITRNYYGRTFNEIFRLIVYYKV
ncbi:MAG: hypothetical protein WBJ84_02140 [Bacteroidales bacterium]